MNTTSPSTANMTSPSTPSVTSNTTSSDAETRYHGVQTALVTDVVDPQGQGRVRIRLPRSPDRDGQGYEAWARLATLMAGDGHGSWFVPDVGDEVLVAFEGGDPRRPYVLGALWNGVDAPPHSMDASGDNPTKMLRSRNGVTVTLEDRDGHEQLILETPGGQRIVLEDGPGKVTVQDRSGSRATFEGSGVTVSSNAKVTVQASSVEINAGTVTINAGMSRFSGTVQVDTLIANAVVASSYTPGVGNIM